MSFRGSPGSRFKRASSRSSSAWPLNAWRSCAAGHPQPLPPSGLVIRCGPTRRPADKFSPGSTSHPSSDSTSHLYNRKICPAAPRNPSIRRHRRPKRRTAAHVSGAVRRSRHWRDDVRCLVGCCSSSPRAGSPRAGGRPGRDEPVLPTPRRRWMSHLSTTWATDFPCAVPMAVSVGSVNRLFRPSANPPQDSSCTPVGAHDLLVGVALEERVRLDLVDRRSHLVVLDEIDEAVGVEVRDTDRPREAVGVDLLNRSPEAVIVAERLVDQVEVDVVETEALEGRLKGGLRVGLAGVLDPQLGGDEQLVTRDATRG